MDIQRLVVIYDAISGAIAEFESPTVQVYEPIIIKLPPRLVIIGGVIGSL